jgi:hypothetical protein
MARPIITRPELQLPMRGVEAVTMRQLWLEHDRRLREMDKA